MTPQMPTSADKFAEMYYYKDYTIREIIELAQKEAYERGLLDAAKRMLRVIK